MPTYNKLVRDKIPEIINTTGKTSITRVLEPEEYRKALQQKLREEAEEYLRAEDDQEALEELADLLEVIGALAVSGGSSWEELEAIRARKAEERGGFRERIFLIQVDDSLYGGDR